MELGKDFGHFVWFGCFVDKSEDWYFDFDGGEESEGKVHFGFGFDSGFMVVERFEIRYFEREVVFWNGCFEDLVEYGSMWKHIEDLV